MPKLIVLLIALLCGSNALLAQPPKQDSFFLAKQKGILGRLGKSISKFEKQITPKKTANPFLQFADLPIRDIRVIPLAFNVDINDTTKIQKNFFNTVLNAVHRDTKEKIVRRNLFFKEGDALLPYRLSDNEKFLRELPYLRDAKILVKKVQSDMGYPMVDIVVLTRDIISLGGSANISSLTKFYGTVKEENLLGTGNMLEFGGIYDKDRTKPVDFSARFIKRNIANKFVDLETGFSRFAPGYISGQRQETNGYISFTKLLVSRYTSITGGLDLRFAQSNNYYYEDSTYDKYLKYTRFLSDVWAGFNFGSKTGQRTDNYKRLRHLVGGRILFEHFFRYPEAYRDQYDYRYADVSGLLMQYSLFKQNYFVTNYIYGFGRQEDIPFGINASFVTGFIIKENKKRPYYGFDFDGKKYSERGYFANYIFKVGSFVNNSKLEDADVLAGVEHFTKLRTFNQTWKHRAFVNLYATRQFRKTLAAPLFIDSYYGIPYFHRGLIESSFRTAIRTENVFFNTRDLLGFKFAPFLAADYMLADDINRNNKLHSYTAFGGGLRTRNESLIFGTLEVKAMWIPKPVGGMRNYHFSFGSNLRFKYNSNFIRKPDFINPH